MVLQTVDVAGFWRFGICDAVSIFLPAVSRLFPIFPIYVAFCLWFISSRISEEVSSGLLFGFFAAAAVCGGAVAAADDGGTQAGGG